LLLFLIRIIYFYLKGTVLLFIFEINYFYLKEMKSISIILYFLSGLIFFVALLGSSLFKPTFDSLSEKTLEVSGLKKSYFESVDDKIDELVYKSKQIELQIEKIKNFFSSEKIDENKYQKEKGEMMEKAFYDPLVTMFNYLYRIGFVFISLIILSFAVIFHLAHRSSSLRKRVRRLEEIVLARG
jgi:regulator of replication initiation timing